LTTFCRELDIGFVVSFVWFVKDYYCTYTVFAGYRFTGRTLIIYVCVLFTFTKHVNIKKQLEGGVNVWGKYSIDQKYFMPNHPGNLANKNQT
jgi:hypothetical protein